MRLNFLLLGCILAASGGLIGDVYAAPDHVPDDRVLEKIDRPAALRALVGWRRLKYSKNNITYEDVGRIGLSEDGRQFVVVDLNGSVLARADLATMGMGVEKSTFFTETTLVIGSNSLLQFGNNFDGAKNVADALYALKRYAEGYEDPRIKEEEARIDRTISHYQGQPRPPFPEEARRYRIQAEAAVKDRRFGDAAQRYGDALKIAPWWSEGHFNRALVLAELSRYAEAILSMKRYLALAPDAPNARQAQDQIYAWEDKAGKSK